VEIEQEEVTINGVAYVKKGSKPEQGDGKMFICRSYAAGVFAGEIESREGKEVVMRNARRLWFWDGAASLSQLANEGVSKPQHCKFPAEVDKVILTNVCEILTMTAKAVKSINGVKAWIA
jgi:hypothetical protein